MYSGEFERIGKRLFAEHLVGGNFGNISIRKGDEGFFIKRTGVYLDVGYEVFVPLTGNAPENASTEYRVHREVYKKTGHIAIVHAHPPHAVAASLVLDEIIPGRQRRGPSLPENSCRRWRARFPGDSR